MEANHHDLSIMLGIAFDSIDVTDQYQVVALFYLAIVPCEGCCNELQVDCPSTDVGTAEWCIEAAKFLRSSGWYVPAKIGDIYRVLAICPKCRPDWDIQSPILPVISGRTECQTGMALR